MSDPRSRTKTTEPGRRTRSAAEASTLPSGRPPKSLGQRSRVSPDEFMALIRETIPLSRSWPFEVVSMHHGAATLRLAFHEDQLRAGGTLNGPTLMTLVDTALYAAVLSYVGLEPLAVTSDLTFRFLRKPAPAPLVAEATLLRVGKRMAVGEVRVRSDGSDDLVVHATGTYALP
ncbi:MAG: PaaI family thioesterase [Sandaracinaceae bacterium]|jgi:uncharacterized protein (TIGR00369 family)|nr:PaaI family thioesterase [Sandaracinaceae bacterium]